MKAGDIPWQLVVLVLAALMVLFVFLLGPLEYELTGFGDGKSIALKKSDAVEATSDAAFREVLVKRIIEDENFLALLKKNMDFKGKDGMSPSVSDVAEAIKNDKNFIKMIKNDSSLKVNTPKSEQAISLDYDDHLRIIESGENFSIATNGNRLIGSKTMILAIGKIYSGGSVYGTYSNTERGIGPNKVRIQQAVPIEFYEGCSVIPRGINSKNRMMFYSDC